MVTIIILSVGITAIFRSLLVSIDHITHLTNRLYASTLLDNNIVLIERMLRTQKVLPFELEHTESVDTGVQMLEFNRQMKISEVDEFLDVFEIDLSYHWKEGHRQKQLSRSAYIADFDLPSQ